MAGLLYSLRPLRVKVPESRGCLWNFPICLGKEVATRPDHCIREGGPGEGCSTLAVPVCKQL